MTCHTVAYSISNLGTSEVSLTAVQDDVLTRSTDQRFLVPSDRPFVHWVYVAGASILRARLVSASLEVRRDQRYIKYLNSSLTDANAVGKVDYFERPLPLVPTEELTVNAVAHTSGNPCYAFVTFGPDTLPDVPAGDIQIIRCTGTTTLTPGAWTTVRVVPEVALPAGTYALIDFYPISAGCLCARARITGQAYRPGKVGIAGSDDRVLASRAYFAGQCFKKYNMGLFTHIAPPEFQFFSTSADTSEIVIMEVVKVS